MLRHNPFRHLHLQYGIAENQIDRFPLFIEEFVLQQGNRIPFPLIYPVKCIKYPETKNNQTQHGQTSLFQAHIPKTPFRQIKHTPRVSRAEKCGILADIPTVTEYYSGLNLNQDKATKPQTVQAVRQGEATLYWFKFKPL
ncbi:TPA: hypothetical protein ACXH5P_001954 [Neisseria meningitidis]